MAENLPTFLIVGAARAGTTSLYEYLRQHPAVYMSPVKEPNFFAVEGARVEHRGPGEDRLRWVTDLDGYRELFRDVTSERAVGEASTLYLYSERAPERIRRHIARARLVAVLRNPVERAYSAFSYLRERGSEPWASFLDALDAEDERVARNWSHIWHYRRMGFYHEQLFRYYARFDPEQIRVFLYEDLEADPLGVMRTLFEHIGVDASFAPDTRLRVNVSGEPRHRLAAPLLRPNRVTRALRPLAVRALNPLVLRVKQQALAKPPLPEAAAERLRADYRDDVARLGELLGRDLSSWLAPLR
jgi:Sulfotransferase domain